MNPLLLSLLPSLVQFGGNTILGAIQLNKAKQYNNMQRPQMSIPKSQLEALDMARSKASQTESPLASLYRQDIGSGLSQGIGAMERAGSAGSDVLAGISKLTQGAQNQYGDLAKTNIAYKENADNSLTAQLQNMAQMEQLQWETNQMQPYMEAMAAKRALEGSGIQNLKDAVYGGVQDFSKSMLLNQIYGDKTKKPTQAIGVMDDTDYYKRLQDQKYPNQVSNTSSSYYPQPYNPNDLSFDKYSWLNDLMQSSIPYRQPNMLNTGNY